MNNELVAFSRGFIKDRYMGVVSCVSNNMPRSFTCWYCVFDGKIYWKSRTNSTHSRAFVVNRNASMCIYDHDAVYPDNKTGVQLIGFVSKVTDPDEMQSVVDTLASSFGPEVYAKNNIEELCAEDTKSTFYSFEISEIKLVAKNLDIHMEKYEKFSL